ncbi:MAG: C1 family peptidase [Acidobacteria bacterium]|nr:C1 family peptidase [Acidobacteriota bacterium]
MPRFLRTAGASSSPRALDVRPDDGDARDYVFRPSLSLLPRQFSRAGRAPVLDQGHEGACVGFALATVINTSLKPRSARAGVSPRMLYEMARRHDEWKGDHYEGTSPRGGMKGWHKHGVTSEGLWGYTAPGKGHRPDREFTPKRAADALRRPIGAYFRIIDSDVGHMQAAVFEGDAVLASAWLHDGWDQGNLVRRRGKLPMIPRSSRAVGLHAFAIVGYGPDGFIIQNSWGATWGKGGRAVLPYDEWFEHRQDAWVARPGPTTLDAKGAPKVFVGGFSGGPEATAQITAMSGWGLDPQVAAHLVNTGDRGALSSGGSLVTSPGDLPAMAQRALLAPVLADGCRHIVLYAHGGLNAEGAAMANAARLWKGAVDRGLAPYFFVWESGIQESAIGWFRSSDDASGPVQFGWSEAWDALRGGTSKVIHASQQALGRALAPVARTVFWNEMKGRTQGASRPLGGAAQFMDALQTMMQSTPGARFKFHLLGHSAGANYHGWLYQRVLGPMLTGPLQSQATLASIELLAPAISITRANQAFASLPDTFVQVHMLKEQDEDSDSIHIYPSSLLTYIADHLEQSKGRAPLLGLRKDFGKATLPWARAVAAHTSRKHAEFDDAGHEIEGALDRCRP